jgi:hypothetical protein
MEIYLHYIYFQEYIVIKLKQTKMLKFIESKTKIKLLLDLLLS